MIRVFRPALVALIGVVLLATGALAAQAPPLAERDRVWAQAYSDLSADPAVRYGQLPNGMRYAIMRNATPAGQASVRLRFGAGSLNETDDKRGLAHYLEHLAFNGSTKVPRGEMVRILERLGLAFGADTNASTGFTETVYRLDLPSTGEEMIDTSLMLMREIAAELLILEEAVAGERGIVLSEERARDTPGLRVFQNRLDFVLEGQLATRRMPIGTVEVLRGARREQLKAFYDDFYRPDRATLILVGDFDPAAIEAKVQARFGDWQARAPKPPEPDLGRPADRGPQVKLMVEPGGSFITQLAWVRPLDTRPDTAAKREADLVERLGLAVLNRRLERLARGENPPFLGAGADSSDEIRSATVATLSINADPAGWRRALIAAEEARRRLIEFGARPDEIEREVTEYRTAYRAAVDAQATRRTPALAAQLLSSIDDGEVFTTPADDLALFERAVAGLTPAKIDAALKATFDGEGPLLFVATPTPIEGGEAALTAALAEAQASKLAAQEASASKTWTYTNFGAPGTVVENRHVLDLDTHFIRFANGVRLTVKQTKFRDQQIMVNARFGHGMLELPRDKTPPWAIGASFIQGGLQELTLEDIEAVLASKIYGVDLSVGEEAFALSGTTRPEDLDVQLQVLTAYMTAPGWRPEGFQRMRTYGLNLHRQMEATPQGVLRRDLEALLHNGDPRWRFPSRDEIEAGRPEDVRRVLEPDLTDGPIEVIIVGDVSVERAIDAVSVTFGALPPRRGDPEPPAGSKQVSFPAPAQLERSHTGREDQAIAYMAWPIGDFASDPQKARELRMVQLIMGLRLIDQVRIAQGTTYSPSSGWDASTVFPGYGYISANVEIPPPLTQGFFTDVEKIAADLAANDVSADELERARRPRVEAIELARQTNQYWLGQLAGGQEDPRRLDWIRSATAGLERVTPADVRRAAQEYLVPGKAWKLVVKKD